MAYGPKLFSTVSIILFLLKFHIGVSGEPQVPCYFIFGDSLVDNGNNNALKTSAKANYPPYGIDFPQGPTGRFTNGRTTADFIGELLGFTDFIPPFATARGEEIIKGVNYGSGGAGILDETGRQLGGRISLHKQLQNHRKTVERLTHLQRNKTFTKEYLSKCIYTVGMGSNDYLNNYFNPQFFPTSRRYTLDQYAGVLTKKYSHQLRTLYKLGARKVAVFGLGLIGCTPAEVASFGTNGTSCVNNVNNAVQLFNDRLKPVVDYLNKDLAHAHYTYINITNIQLSDFSAAGITVVNAPCCRVTADGLCAPNTIPCGNRGRYEFYDAFHPTEIVNFFLSSRAFHVASPLNAYPVNIGHLVGI